MKRDSMIFYASFHEAAKALESDTDKAALYDAIFEYALFGKEFELTGTPRAMFMLIKPQLDANIRKYKNGKRPKKKQTGSKREAPTKQTGSKTEGNVNVNSNDNVNDNDNSKADGKPPKFNFKSSLLSLGVEEQVASDWLKVRSKLSASNTETAFKVIKTEIEKTNHSANECITEAVARSWRGFKAEWMKKTDQHGNPTKEEPVVLSQPDNSKLRQYDQYKK